MADLKDKRIVVTGATGMVGSHLVARLLADGCRHITLPVRNVSRIGKLYKTLDREGADYKSAELRVIETALNNPIELSDAFEGADTVFNCAAAVSLGAMDDELLIEGNIEIVSHVVNACLKAGVDVLVHVSSIAALGGPPEGKNCIDETMVPESVSGMPAYYAGKFLSENEIARGAAYGLKTVVVNPALVIGAGDWKSASAAMVPYMTKGVPVYTEGMTAMVDVRDVARAMIALSQEDKAVGERYILSGGNISYREFLTLSANASGKKAPRIKAGRFLLGAAWRGAWLWGRITGSRSQFTRDLARTLLKKTCYSTDKIRECIGFEFTPLGKTIDRVVKQYLAENG